MKEFIDKLISRLEEYEQGRLEMHDWQGQTAIVDAISIVNKLAEEYKTSIPLTDYDLIIKFIESEIERTPSFAEHDTQIKIMYYVQQLQEQNNNGWISCSSALVPPDYCIVQIQEDNGYLWIPKVGEYRASTGKWRIEGAFEHSNGWLEDTEHFKVIAWQPLPPKFEPKGE